ncbi:FecR family protein [Pedobacter nyackensis]|uniref:FecR family protein n=1 Tax=Pedobacter nyackensis TaxID=475255 RepID=A0A1W2EW71_9SPHI|nr:FecR family protein [Pedobacter nyackensis]
MFKKYIANQCTEEETYAIFELLHAAEYESFFKELIDAELEEQVQGKFNELPEVKAALIQARKNIILQVNEAKYKGPSLPARLWFRFAVAAVFLLCAGLAVLFYTDWQASHENESYSGAQIGPGGPKAILTLADGSKIILNEAAKGNLSNQAGVSVTKTEDGKLIYTVGEGQDQQGEKAKIKGLTNTISTPRGGQYQVNLPDGTKVWLNAESVLKFPLSFAGLEERKVELRGEAYFEVAKVMRDKRTRMPFLVKCERQMIEVLGTHFNVNSYADDQETKTTLLEGAVKVLPLNGSATDQTILKPGQQAKISRHSSRIDVIEIDPLTEIAWKNGQFFFENEPIESIMKEISRWYDVEIVYKADVSDKTVWGSVNRYSNVSKVLSILELTGEIHFKVEGRRIIVQK